MLEILLSVYLAIETHRFVGPYLQDSSYQYEVSSLTVSSITGAILTGSYSST